MSEEEQLLCGRCQKRMILGKAKLSYLGNEFVVDLLRCPSCGKVFIPESLATGKVLKVEELLEDK